MQTKRAVTLLGVILAVLSFVLAGFPLLTLAVILIGLGQLL